jgi:hypothetical protein
MELKMDRLLIGDNQFFGVNHISDAKGMQNAIRFSDTKEIMNVLDYAYELGIKTFVCSTHSRISEICDIVRANPSKYIDYEIYPTIPDVHKYANAVSDLGIIGTLKEYLPSNPFSFFTKGSLAVATKDFISIMEMLIDIEMKMFRGIKTGVIFIQNNIADLLLGLGMKDVFIGFANYVKKKYNAKPGFMTMNLPQMINFLEASSIKDAVICSSINKIGFRMSGGIKLYEEVIKGCKYEIIAMQVLAAGAIKPEEAFNYICEQNGIKSILFGSSSASHILHTKQIINNFDRKIN